MRIGAFAAVVLTIAVPAASARSVDATRDVRAGTLAIESYAAEHGGYAGATVAKLRRYYPVRNLLVVRATRITYCIQTARRPWVRKNGPNTAIGPGRC